MDAYQQELHIEDELLSGMRADANAVLQKLLQNMVEKDSLEGKLTISLEISLTPEWIPNNDPLIEGSTRKALTPKFSHKVGSIMQIKKEEKGGRNVTAMNWYGMKKEKNTFCGPLPILGR